MYFGIENLLPKVVQNRSSSTTRSCRLLSSIIKFIEISLENYILVTSSPLGRIIPFTKGDKLLSHIMHPNGYETITNKVSANGHPFVIDLDKPKGWDILPVISTQVFEYLNSIYTIIQ